MASLARTVVSRLRHLFGDRRYPKRRRAQLPFTILVKDRRLVNNGARRSPSMNGHTLDLSMSGLGLVVPAIRIGGLYLVADNRSLEVKLELPLGPIEMRVVPVRYENLEDHATETGYLIGARITEMSEEHWSRFKAYIKSR